MEMINVIAYENVGGAHSQRAPGYEAREERVCSERGALVQGRSSTARSSHLQAAQASAKQVGAPRLTCITPEGLQQAGHGKRHRQGLPSPLPSPLLNQEVI